MINISFEVIDDPPRLVVTELIPYGIDRVWLAQTEGLYVKQWWAPEDYSNDEVDITIEEGGSWRVVQRDPEGNQFSFYGRVQAAEPRELLRISLTSELFPETTLILTQEFAPSRQGAVVVSTYEFPTRDELASYLHLGGIDRLRDTSVKLDALLQQMA